MGCSPRLLLWRLLRSPPWAAGCCTACHGCQLLSGACCALEPRLLCVSSSRGAANPEAVPHGAVLLLSLDHPHCSLPQTGCCSSRCRDPGRDAIHHGLSPEHKWGKWGRVACAWHHLARAFCWRSLAMQKMGPEQTQQADLACCIRKQAATVDPGYSRGMAALSGCCCR